MLHINLLNDTKDFLKQFVVMIIEIAELEKELTYINWIKIWDNFLKYQSFAYFNHWKISCYSDNMTIYVTQRTLGLYLISLNFKVQFLTSHLKTNIIKKIFKLFDIGGSAGCLEKIIQIINNLPCIWYIYIYNYSYFANSEK